MKPRARLLECFPELQVNSISEIPGGWDSDVLVVNERWVFRLPKRPEVKEWITKEISLLPQLEPVLPVPVPRFEFVCPEHGVVGYTKIEGTPLIRGLFPNVAMKRLARQLGAFLTALHRFPVSRARERRFWERPPDVEERPLRLMRPPALCSSSLART